MSSIFLFFQTLKTVLMSKINHTPFFGVPDDANTVNNTLPERRSILRISFLNFRCVRPACITLITLN